ncbi:hypothetical protein [Myxococcus sp. AS-1-15]|uniref:hypothetical protein n=1 Tax=Myxococcus sp. AS-1-15 TaxID=2874600 RepID=UPI001CC0DAB0|nr:hypothetical protein [Myxococcus sp. AS-1-15]MBZ4402021.1 hypothetical protein [Myxococcus sp. AS-1-15]
MGEDAGIDEVPQSLASNNTVARTPRSNTGVRMDEVVKGELAEAGRRGHIFSPNPANPQSFKCENCGTMSRLDVEGAAAALNGGECIPAFADWCRPARLRRLSEQGKEAILRRRQEVRAALDSGWAADYAEQQRTELIALAVLLGEHDQALRLNLPVAARAGAQEHQKAVDLACELRFTKLMEQSQG